MEAEVADSKQRLEKYEGKSHSDRPAGTAAGSSLPSAQKSSRKRGGQPGHRRHSRQLTPTEECNQVDGLKPELAAVALPHCLVPIPSHCVTKVAELPKIRLHVTEDQFHRLTCPCCSKQTCAELPPGVPSGQRSPQLVALTSLLIACFDRANGGSPCSARRC